eukprot:12686-Heterococcus_DN1.PRE.3
MLSPALRRLAERVGREALLSRMHMNDFLHPNSASACWNRANRTMLQGCRVLAALSKLLLFLQDVRLMLTY